jgi:hypothetical protein
MVVEKSSTRRPAKLFVKIPSSLSAIVILKTSPACLRPRRDPKLRCHVREAIPRHQMPNLADGCFSWLPVQSGTNLA